ncbi:MAG: hypothetical protein ACKO91_18790 [Acidimicrobiales bacterium]
MSGSTGGIVELGGGSGTVVVGGRSLVVTGAGVVAGGLVVGVAAVVGVAVVVAGVAGAEVAGVVEPVVATVVVTVLGLPPVVVEAFGEVTTDPVELEAGSGAGAVSDADAQATLTSARAIAPAWPSRTGKGRERCGRTTIPSAAAAPDGALPSLSGSCRAAPGAPTWRVDPWRRPGRSP